MFLEFMVLPGQTTGTHNYSHTPTFNNRPNPISYVLKEIQSFMQPAISAGKDFFDMRVRNFTMVITGREPNIYAEKSFFLVDGGLASLISGLVLSRLFPGPSLAVGASFPLISYVLIMFEAAMVSKTPQAKATTALAVGSIGASMLTRQFFSSILKIAMTRQTTMALGSAAVIGLSISARLKMLNGQANPT